MYISNVLNCNPGQQIVCRYTDRLVKSLCTYIYCIQELVWIKSLVFYMYILLAYETPVCTDKIPTYPVVFFRTLPWSTNNLWWVTHIGNLQNSANFPSLFYGGFHSFLKNVNLPINFLNSIWFTLPAWRSGLRKEMTRVRIPLWYIWFLGKHSSVVVYKMT
jgi:hypothetical protein